MKILLVKRLSALAIATLIIPSTETIVQAQPKSEQILIAQRAREIQRRKFQGNTPPVIFNAGILNAAKDHYFDLEVRGEPLDRLKVFCITFHELNDVQVVDPESGQVIPHTVNHGVEEFTVTFNKSVPLGQNIRVIIRGATVRGVTTGQIIPYRVFSESSTFGTIPLGTAMVRTPDEN